MAGSLEAALRRRALQWLAQREHSRQELRRKLERWQLAQAARAAGPDAEPADEAALGAPASLIEEVLQTLQAQGHLSEARLVESRVHARQSRFGMRRIERELGALGVTLGAEQRQALARTEIERARQVLQRRFGEASAPTPQEQAKRLRFLAARGFTGEAIRCAMRPGGPSLEDLESAAPALAGRPSGQA